MRRQLFATLLLTIAGCQSAPPSRNGIEQPVANPAQRPAPTPMPPPRPVTTSAPAASETEDLAQTSRKIIADFAVFDEDFVKRSGEKMLLKSAIEAVKDSMKDPSSAQVRGARIVRTPSGRVVCGEVNAKNSYGGYVGFAPFVASATTAMVYHSEPTYPALERIYNAGLMEACLGK